ncbi:universal stress protein [Marinomonas sp. 2405UD68-3]|uniref:universal stress protein n=1 Tax=Marinomonas sp. 2405UD68-3 TaxID=3391835 RepID=UPI0039C971A6
MITKINTMIYAYDLAGKTQESMDLVMSMALQHQAEVILLHVIDPVSPQTEGMIQSYIPPETFQKIREKAINDTREIMQTQLTEYLNDNLDPLSKLVKKPRCLVAIGTPNEVIKSTSEKHQADLIIMNNRTHSKLGQIMLGSNANKVIHQSKIPVLVVPIH